MGKKKQHSIIIRDPFRPVFNFMESEIEGKISSESLQKFQDLILKAKTKIKKDEKDEFWRLRYYFEYLVHISFICDYDGDFHDHNKNFASRLKILLLNNMAEHYLKDFLLNSPNNDLSLKNLAQNIFDDEKIYKNYLEAIDYALGKVYTMTKKDKFKNEYFSVVPVPFLGILKKRLNFIPSVKSNPIVGLQTRIQAEEYDEKKLFLEIFTIPQIEEKWDYENNRMFRFRGIQAQFNIVNKKRRDYLAAEKMKAELSKFQAVRLENEKERAITHLTKSLHAELGLRLEHAFKSESGKLVLQLIHRTFEFTGEWRQHIRKDEDSNFSTIGQFDYVKFLKAISFFALVLFYPDIHHFPKSYLSRVTKYIVNLIGMYVDKKTRSNPEISKEAFIKFIETAELWDVLLAELFNENLPVDQKDTLEEALKMVIISKERGLKIDIPASKTRFYPLLNCYLEIFSNILQHSKTQKSLLFYKVWNEKEFIIQADRDISDWLENSFSLKYFEKAENKKNVRYGLYSIYKTLKGYNIEYYVPKKGKDIELNSYIQLFSISSSPLLKKD